MKYEWITEDTSLTHLKTFYTYLFQGGDRVQNIWIGLQFVGIGGSKGVLGTRLPSRSISFIFMQFLAKILSNNRFSAPTQGLAPPPLVWEIMDST